ncbi:hypothetical protein [Spirillospora sp. NPDC029432]|uniref:hypothetical protein n=1 Tax=Spirillospora sp. NPDC029432 TaxID=3154599 RepID=UPI003451B70B
MKKILALAISSLVAAVLLGGAPAHAAAPTSPSSLSSAQVASDWYDSDEDGFWDWWEKFWFGDEDDDDWFDR